jgi:hypothetical protein
MLWTGFGLSLATATHLRWALLFVCGASLLFLIVERLNLKKETEPCNTK